MNIEAKYIIPLIYFGIAIFIFEVMNWYGTKYVQDTWVQIGKYALYTLPFQMIGYICLVKGLNLGYATFQDIWNLIIITSTITWSIKLCTAYGFFHKLPTLGNGIALMLLVLSNVINKLVK